MNGWAYPELLFGQKENRVKPVNYEQNTWDSLHNTGPIYWKYEKMGLTKAGVWLKQSVCFSLIIYSMQPA